MAEYIDISRGLHCNVWIPLGLYLEGKESLLWNIFLAGKRKVRHGEKYTLGTESEGVVWNNSAPLQSTTNPNSQNVLVAKNIQRWIGESHPRLFKVGSSYHFCLSRQSTALLFEKFDFIWENTEYDLIWRIMIFYFFTRPILPLELSGIGLCMYVCVYVCMYVCIYVRVRL